MTTTLKSTETVASTGHPVVSREEWIVARRLLLQKEKELTRMYDRLSAERRELPWAKIDKHYVFDGPNGKQTLADLFEGRSQLIVQHFMFAPGWAEGCVGCSFSADNVDNCLPHLENHDVSFVAISRAPLAEIEAFKKRMDWKFRWLSSNESDFNFDYNVSFTKEDEAKGEVYYNFELSKFEIEELPGISIFYKDECGEIYHTYSAFGRGGESLVTTYAYLDLTPKGRNENGPGGNLTDWVRHHDKYKKSGSVDNTGRYQKAEEASTCCSSKEVKA